MVTWLNACFPSFQDHRTSAAEDSDWPGNNNSDSAHLAHSGLVLGGTKDANCHSPGAAATEPDASTRPDMKAPSNQDETGCHDVIRQSLKTTGLSDDIISIIIKSWWQGTHRKYQSYLTKWINFCHKRETDYLSASVKDFLEFLYDIYSSQNLSYSAMNTCSAVSAILIIDGVPAGQHPLVCRFLKGAFYQKPALRCYTVTWDMSILLSYLRNLSPH